MSFSHGRKLGTGAAAATVIALLSTAVGAQAHPALPLAPADCAGYQFPGGRMTFHYPNIGQTEFDTTAGGTHVDTTAITRYPQGGDMPGTVVGDITGTKIHLTVTRQGTGRTYSPLIIDGQVGADDRGHGTYTYRGGDSGTWDSLEALRCLPAPKPQPAPAPAPEPKPLAPDAASAPPQDAPTPEKAATPTSEPNQVCIPDPFGLDFPGAC